MVVVHAFNPSTREAGQGGFLSSRPARTTQRNHVSKKTKRKRKTKKKKKKREGEGKCVHTRDYGMHMHVLSKDNLQETVFSSHHVGLRYEMYVSGLAAL